MEDAIRKQLMDYGYGCIIEVPGRGVCAVSRMAFTTGLFYNIDIVSEAKGCYEGRYCFKTMLDAIESLVQWDGVGDPPGGWIKHKGGTGEYSNPNLDI